MDFDIFYKAEQKARFGVLGYAILNFIEKWRNPSVLKKFEKDKLLQTVKNIFIKNAIISAHDTI